MAIELKAQAEKPAVHEIAGGWITEKEGTEVPAFLRVCYVLIASAAVCYLVLYMYGDVGNAERGPLVKQFDLATITSEPFMYSVAALVAVFFVGVSVYAAKKDRE
jgi:hypothetical protein